MSLKPWISVVLVVAVAGCQFTDEQRLIGAWSADQQRTVIPTFPFEGFTDHMRGAAKSSQLKLSADHTFILTGISEVGGDWRYRDGTIVLRAHAAQGHKHAFLDGQRLSLKVDRDFDVMELDYPTGFGMIKLILNKTA